MAGSFFYTHPPLTRKTSPRSVARSVHLARASSHRDSAVRATVKVTTRKTIASLTLGHGIWSDADTTNDSWRAKGAAR